MTEVEGHSRNGRRNPSVPIEKLNTGGTAPTLNSDDAWRMVPSPPNVTTRPIFSASGPDLAISRRVNGGSERELNLVAKLRRQQGCRVCLRGRRVHQDTLDGYICHSVSIRATFIDELATCLSNASIASTTSFVRCLLTMRTDCGGRSCVRRLS